MFYNPYRNIIKGFKNCSKVFQLLPSPCINCTIHTPNKHRVINTVQFSPYLVLGLWSSSDSLTSSLTADSWNSESFESSLLTWKRKQHLFHGEDHCKASRAPHCTTNCWRATSTAKAHFTSILLRSNRNKRAKEKEKLKFKHKLSPGGWFLVDHKPWGPYAWTSPFILQTNGREH